MIDIKSAADLDHGVLLVGYHSGKYWIKNSWGVNANSNFGYVPITDNDKLNAGICIEGYSVSVPLEE